MPNTNYSPAEKQFITKYQSPTGYASWQTLSKGIVRQLKSNRIDEDARVLWKHLYMTAPAYYITDELYESLVKTDTKVATTPNLVNHQFYVLTSREISAVDYAHVVINSKQNLYNDRYGEKDVYVVFYRSQHTDKPPAKVGCDFSFNWKDLINPIDQASIKIAHNFNEVKDHMCCEECTKRVYHHQTNLIINLILLMNIQPEIVTQIQSRVPTKAKGFKASSKDLSYKTINWVGKDFTKRVIRKTSETSQGSNTPKSSHWRRGHWHTVSQGPGRKQKRMKWFQPTFIVGNA